VCCGEGWSGRWWRRWGGRSTCWRETVINEQRRDSVVAAILVSVVRRGHCDPRVNLVYCCLLLCCYAVFSSPSVLDLVAVVAKSILVCWSVFIFVYVCLCVCSSAVRASNRSSVRDLPNMLNMSSTDTTLLLVSFRFQTPDYFSLFLSFIHSFIHSTLCCVLNWIELSWIESWWNIRVGFVWLCVSFRIVVVVVINIFRWFRCWIQCWIQCYCCCRGWWWRSLLLIWAWDVDVDVVVGVCLCLCVCMHDWRCSLMLLLFVC